MLALGGLPLVAPRLALAEPSPTELAVARRLFEDAVRFERESRWELAASKLKDAIAVKDTPGLRFHLAHCEDKLGHLVEAMIHYDHARELIASGAKAPDVEEVLEPARRTLEQRLPSVLLVAPAEIANLEVELDGKPAARSILGRPAPVDPGTHRVVVRAPGYADFAQQLELREGEHPRVMIQMVEGTSSADSHSPGVVTRVQSGPDVDHRDTGIPTRTYALVGESAFTLAALGVGVGFSLVKNTAYDRADRAQRTVDGNAGVADATCAGDRPSSLIQACSDLDDAIAAYHRARLVSTIGLAGASVGAAATLLTFALWPRSSTTLHVEATKSSSWLGIAGEF